MVDGIFSDAVAVVLHFIRCRILIGLVENIVFSPNDIFHVTYFHSFDIVTIVTFFEIYCVFPFESYINILLYCVANPDPSPELLQ